MRSTLYELLPEAGGDDDDGVSISIFERLLLTGVGACVDLKRVRFLQLADNLGGNARMVLINHP